MCVGVGVFGAQFMFVNMHMLVCVLAQCLQTVHGLFQTAQLSRGQTAKVCRHFM
jgi:hypothetical protein